MLFNIFSNLKVYPYEYDILFYRKRIQVAKRELLI
jgi:hypothetical protein